MIAAARLLAMLGGLLALLARGLATLRGFERMDEAQRQRAIADWSRALLRVCRVELRVDGTPPRGACMLAINHVSWLDIAALNAVEPTRFVAKADIDRWPLVGALARGAGTLFIERERARDAMRVMHGIAQALRDGQRVSVFPEGTTSPGDRILPLHANLFQAAVSACAPVQPVLLRYLDAATGAPSQAPAYVGDDSLLCTLWRIARAPRLCASVSYLTPLHGGERRALARAVQDSLQHALSAGAATAQPAAAPAWSTAQ
ncbi:1-acyl-sn-glycerol-3-phosphate acyltransferase [mine drainage metagenome]|uniref:1-acyl-sn-glycerol-3-phosphate acyltransferase n=1 Tax=mine drainage metagenome TaxID=410659 RepID=A0A1J5Q9J2_9ZZZZ